MKVIFKNCSLEFQKLGVEFISSQFTIGKRVNNNGQIFDYSSSQIQPSKWCYSAQFDVENMVGKTVELHTNLDGSNAFAIAFFSDTPSNDTFMSASSIQGTSGAGWQNLSTVVPSGAKYIWVTCYASYLENVAGSIE